MTVAAVLALAPCAVADPVVAAAGDIACGAETSDGNCNGQATAVVVAAMNPNAVLVLGDNQYEYGSLSDFNSYYGPTWGQWKSITRPVAGNHEYGTSGASGYFDYFNGSGAASGLAGARGKGYYSWDLGTWHMVALNSNCSQVGGCGVGSPQETWLRADLAAHSSSCTLAYMHHPRWSSDLVVGSTPGVDALVQALYDNHADLMLAGHAHTYERFAPQDPAGNLDSNGLVQIIAGTGGKSEFAFGSATLPNSRTHADTFGALQLTLHASSYDWRFVPAAGNSFTDSGAALCHGRTAPAPTGPTAVTDSASEITRTSATLNAHVNPNGSASSYHFEYGRTTSYGSSTPEVSVGSATTAVQVARTISGLAKNTGYHFRVVARWDSGAIARGADRTFKTTH